MSAKTLAIGLFSNRIDVLLCSGDHVIAGRRIPVNLPHEGQPWCRAALGAANAVKAAAKELGAAGAAATVFYRSPTQCVDYAGMKMKSAVEAQQAAILACGDSLACPLTDASARTMIVKRDKSGGQTLQHVVVAADADDTVAHIARMIESAELKFVSAMPLDAAMMAQSIAESAAEPGENIARLFVGEHRSFFVIAHAGAILFARPINLGIESLVNSLTRPIRTSAADSIELSHDEAAAIFHAFGFPSRNEVVHKDRRLLGGHIVPLLQPVLQRFIVELRQSLRFALPEAQRHAVKMTVAGPGSAAPGFTELLGEELRLVAKSDPRFAPYDYQQPVSPGNELVAAVSQPALYKRLGLQPRTIAHGRHVNRMRRWLWTGAAAALLMIGLDATRCHVQIAQAQRHVDVLTAQSADRESQRLAGEKLMAAVGAMNKLENTIAAECGATVNLRAALQEISRITPASIRLTGISFHPQNRGTAGTLNGYAFAPEPLGGKTLLEPYIEQLRQCPLFENVMLSSVESGMVGGAPGQRFEVDFVSLTCPAAAGAPAITAAASDAIVEAAP